MTTLDDLLMKNINDVIKSMCQSINLEKSDQLYKEFIENTNHLYKDDTLDITKLMDKYHIEGHELFYSMYTSGIPSGMGMLSHKEDDKFTLEKAKQVLCDSKNGIDWYNGKAFKTKYRTKTGEEQLLPRRRFDDRNYYGACYFSVLKLLNEKMFSSH